MLFPFKLRIYDTHDKEGGEEDGWLRFDFIFDIKDIKITGFREWVLFDHENNPQRCTWIFFDDGDSVYGCYSIEKFLEIYTHEYKDLYTECLITQMKLDGEIEVKPWWKFWK